MITSILYQKVIEYLFWENQSIRNKVIYLTLFSGLLLISSSQIGGVATKCLEFWESEKLNII